VFTDEPYVDQEQRLQMTELGRGFWQVSLKFGFMERPDVPQALEQRMPVEPGFNAYTASFFISRETVVPTAGEGMAPWREELFAALSRNASSVVNYFGLPGNQVIELGSRIHI
jgi:KUP system potassium uptake protein